MDRIVFKRDALDLCYSRPTKVVFVEDEPEDPEDEKIRSRRNEQHKSLDDLSATLGPNLQKNKAFECCVEFAAYLLNNTRPDELAEQSQGAPSRTFPCRSDASNEEEILQSRISSAAESKTQLSRIFKQILVHILTHRGVHDLENVVEKHEPQFFYRLTDAQSYTVYDPIFGFICGKWRSASGPFFSIPTGQDFENHMSGQKIATPYISMTESPGRLWELLRVVKRDWKRASTSKIAIIDASKLQRMGVDFARSTDLRDGFGILRWPHAPNNYITPTQWLAQFWIPQKCIVAMVDLTEFKSACEPYNIVNGKCSSRPSSGVKYPGQADNHRR